MADNQTVVQRVRALLNKAIKGINTDAMVAALAEGDSINQENILAVKQNIVVATSEGIYLEKLMSRMGVTKPKGVGLADDVFRELGIKQTNSKLVTNIFLDILETFYGAEAIRANATSGAPEGYVLQDGMNLIVKIDSKADPINITFNLNDFTNINSASAAEVANVISKQSFAAGYGLTASAQLDQNTKLNFVQLMSGTKGPKSSVTVLGGSAQSVLKFPTQKNAIARLGTQFTTSFSGSNIRFTWTSGPNPSLFYVSPGDMVNIYGAGYSINNRGSFEVVNVSDGSVGNAYFEIINPTFTPQGPVNLAGVGGSSGHGSVSVLSSLNIISGAVRASNVVTLTTVSPHGLSAGQTITVNGVSNVGFNGTFIIASTTLNTISYAQSGANASSGGGNVTYKVNITDTGAIRSSGISTITTAVAHGLSAGQQVIISGVDDSSFDGTFVLTSASGNSFTYVQDQSNDVTFFAPTRNVIQMLPRYASVYEVNPYEVVLFLPATTRVVKRDLIGSAHLHESSKDLSYPGPYLFSPKSGFSITKTSTTLSAPINAGDLKTVCFGLNTSSFPDQEGFIVFDWGTTNQEGPVRYLGRPSDGSLLLDPSYKFQKTHNANADISLIYSKKAYTPNQDGSDYPFYLTSTVQGRIEAEALSKKLAASGIFLLVNIIYPVMPGQQDVKFVYSGDVV